MGLVEAGRLLTAQEAATRLRIRLHRLYELAHEGTIPHVRLGRTLRIDPVALEAFIERGGTREGARK